jgi:hypothetical protein
MSEHERQYHRNPEVILPFLVAVYIEGYEAILTASRD